MSGDRIHYEELAQDALRGVIRKIMSDIEKTGELPGEHHFFIAFDTQARGVEISARLKEQYREEMTIVLQHQFWDLKVEEEYFEVKLSFNNILERLVIPYKAIKVFFDPSVPYGLQFGISEDGRDNDTREPVLSGADGKSSSMQEFSLDNNRRNVASENSGGKNGIDDADGSSSSEEQDAHKSADIVSLDTFRKK